MSVCGRQSDIRGGNHFRGRHDDGGVHGEAGLPVGPRGLPQRGGKVHEHEHTGGDDGAGRHASSDLF
jgi:hypothetical protein